MSPPHRHKAQAGLSEDPMRSHGLFGSITTRSMTKFFGNGAKPEKVAVSICEANTARNQRSLLAGHRTPREDRRPATRKARDGPIRTRELSAPQFHCKPIRMGGNWSRLLSGTRFSRWERPRDSRQRGQARIPPTRWSLGVPSGRLCDRPTRGVIMSMTRWREKKQTTETGQRPFCGLNQPGRHSKSGANCQI